ncbi:MAG: arginase, partial [Chitinophagaceae bacterium]
MSDYLNLVDFLEPVNTALLSEDQGYREGQIGKVISVFEEHFPDLDAAQVVLVGCGESRGAGQRGMSAAPEAVRKAFYNLYYWHTDVALADIGNVKAGNTVQDSQAALKVVLRELMAIGKRVVILGGSHDLTLAQYYAFADEQKSIEAVGVDAIVDIHIDSPRRADNFLMELLTAEPNFLKHYNHLAFQSYFVHPRMLETMDKLRFDCYRVGAVKEHLEDMEPVIRNCALMTFDISAFASAFAPASTLSPNGLNGEEACTLMQYGGMSPQLQTLGIYGFDPGKDRDGLTAQQIAHMLWYFVDGCSRGNREVALTERDSFNEFHTIFAEVDTVFL